jgi:hypothetical protein
MNCEWEWSVGNITIQAVPMEGEPLFSEVERIVNRLFQKREQAGAFQDFGAAGPVVTQRPESFQET